MENLIVRSLIKPNSFHLNRRSINVLNELQDTCKIASDLYQSLRHMAGIVCMYHENGIYHILDKTNVAVSPK